MNWTRYVGLLTTILALALVASPPADAQELPEDMPAPELVKLAPEDTYAVIAADGSRGLRDRLPPSESVESPVQPKDVKKAAAFLGWSKQTVPSMMGPGKPQLPFCLILNHDVDRDTVESWLSEEGSRVGSAAGSEIYRRGKMEFTAIAGDGALVAGSSKDRVSQLLQFHAEGQGPGLPDKLTESLRPNDRAAAVMALVVPPQVSAIVRQKKSVPEPAKGLDAACLSVAFPGEEMAARLVAMFKEARHAKMSSRMVNGQLQMLKQGGLGKMVPGQDAGKALEPLLETVKVSSSGSELTVSAQPSFSDIRGAVKTVMGGAMKLGGDVPGMDAGSGPPSMSGSGGSSPFGGGQGSFDGQQSSMDGGGASQQGGGTEATAASADVSRTASRETEGVRLRVNLEQGDWFGEQRTLVKTKLSNSGSSARSVDYQYEVISADGTVIQSGGGAKELEPSGSYSFSTAVEEGNIQGVRIVHLGVEPGSSAGQD